MSLMECLYLIMYYMGIIILELLSMDLWAGPIDVQGLISVDGNFVVV